MTESSLPSQRAAVAAELEEARREFHEMLASLSPGDWDQPSGNRAWTNGQLLFHVMFGFLLVPRLWRIMQLFGRLPTGWSRAFTRGLDYSTPLFNRINGVLPRLGALAYGPKALARAYDRVHAQILRRLSSISEADRSRGMHYPTRWDPRFSEIMQIDDLPRWAVAHLRHHRTQLRPSHRV
jgi:uncharacterized damage-inducible protein DinB